MSPRERYGIRAVRVYRALIDPLIRPLRPRIVRLCQELGPRHVLDIATATGAQCRMLGRAGIRATGLDLSEAMIAEAIRRGGPNTDYVAGSAYELPFDDDAFDAALLLLALHEHTEDERSQMLREAERVVRPGGALLIAEFAEPARSRGHLPWQVIRFIESTAGPEHAAGFRDFVAGGCLDGLLERHAMAAERHVRSHFGAIDIAVVRRRSV